VVTFGGRRVDSVDQFVRMVGAAPPGVPVDVRIYRDKALATVVVTPSRRKAVARGVNIEAPFAWRGMTLENPTPKVRARFDLPEDTVGVVVTRVEAGGVAEKAGLEPGQVIRQIGEERIKGVRRLRQMAPHLNGPLPIVVEGEEEVLLPAGK